MPTHSFSRREEYQRRKRNTRIVRVTVFFVVLVSITALLSYITHRQSIRISEVDLSGGILVAQSDVSAEASTFLSGSYAFLFPKNNIFIYPHAALENDLKQKFKRIDTISISRKNFHTLQVTITERKPVALWCGVAPQESGMSAVGSSTVAVQLDVSSQCYFMDDNSTIFASAPTFSGDAYFKYYGNLSENSVATSTVVNPTANPIGVEYIASSSVFGDIGQFVDSVRNLGLHPQYLVSGDDGEYTLVVAGGGQLYFNDQTPLSKVTENLQALLTRVPVLMPNSSHDLPVDYIDLRYGNKLFYKLSGAAGLVSSSTKL